MKKDDKWIYVADIGDVEAVEMFKDALKNNKLVQTYSKTYHCWEAETKEAVQWLIENPVNRYDVRVERI